MVIMVFSFTACGDSSSDEGQSDEQQSASEESAAAPADTAKAKIGDFEVNIKDYELIQDDEGEDAVFIIFDVTNNGEEAADFDSSLWPQCFQNGEELEFGKIYEGRDEYYDNIHKEIEPGTTLEMKFPFRTLDRENPITAQIISMGEELRGEDSSEGMAEKVFEIAE